MAEMTFPKSSDFFVPSALVVSFLNASLTASIAFLRAGNFSPIFFRTSEMFPVLSVFHAFCMASRAVFPKSLNPLIRVSIGLSLLITSLIKLTNGTIAFV